ncbi:MAG: glycoside hydrolase family 15 protein [Pseudomonadota bacterium]|nr:glycoside hydrolase family 15 protein [Pseudomonadota bacterium]
MSRAIEDYALIGNGCTAALVGKDGSIDWLCLPRFDSPALFTALLGTKEQGAWRIAPAAAEEPGIRRRYREGTLVLETEFTTPDGAFVLVDCMDRGAGAQRVLRMVRGERGRVPVSMALAIRHDFGLVIPAITRVSERRCEAVAGPDRLTIDADVPLRIQDAEFAASFTIEAGQEITFALSWTSSFDRCAAVPAIDVKAAVEEVTHCWEHWSGQYSGSGKWARATLRSLITLKALAAEETGGIVAAPTTSLPEELGGAKNWDYRYCWLRDGTFTMYALLDSGFVAEAKAWLNWLLRAIGGSPDRAQIMYTLSGSRRARETNINWLDGYGGSRPVRVGNGASEQFQLDVFGELLDIFYQSCRHGLCPVDHVWKAAKGLAEHLETIWHLPDDGFWEVRGSGRQYTESKVLAWAAVDRAIRMVEEFGVEGPVARWRTLRAQIHDQVCRAGFDPELGSFVQYYGGKTLDASLLRIALVGFLPPDDPRIAGTIAAVERHLMQDGLLRRYRSDGGSDDSPVREGVFIACSFWLVDNYVLQGRSADAKRLFERVLALGNDLGLLSEEYDPVASRLLGNFPQALSHVALVNSAHNLTREDKPAERRSGFSALLRGAPPGGLGGEE